jgi:Lysylphosphatidylglycerol synthase TM region
VTGRGSVSTISSGMWGQAAEIAAAIERALASFVEAVSGAAPGWLALGVLLHLGNQVARGRGWCALLRMAAEGDPCLRRRDAIAAWMAGAGTAGVASARGGDAVRVLLLRRRLPRAGCPVLAGTLVAEGVGEVATGALLLAVALLAGVGPELGMPPAGALPWVLAAVVAVAAVAGIVARVPRLRRFATGVGHGCASLRAPSAYARGVLPWQLTSRVLRLAALACFLAAFGLPATPAAVLLVVAAQSGGRLLPFAPASVGAGAAMLAASFAPVTGTAVPAAELTAFFIGTSAVLTAVGTALALAICLRTVPWRELVSVLRPARRSPAPAA